MKPPAICALPSNGDRPFWCVMIPCHIARPDYLAELLCSVLQQDPGKNLMQIAVIDDASVDLVRRIAHDRVAVHREWFGRHLEPVRFRRLFRDIRGAEVVGLKPHAERTMKANSRGIAVAASESNLETVLALACFDVVLFADVLEPLGDPLSALRLSRNLLESDGCLIGSMPNVAHWTVR
jgi:cellulose synthase/poly-beta-1,6-N-acetylglucosamine synthase-like glycosyltransferase